MPGSDRLADREPRDLAADLQYHSDLLAAARHTADGLAARVYELERERDDARTELGELQSRTTQRVADADQAVFALEREVETLTTRVGQLAAERDAARALGVADMKAAVEAMARERDAALAKAETASRSRAHAAARDELAHAAARDELEQLRQTLSETTIQRNELLTRINHAAATLRGALHDVGETVGAGRDIRVLEDLVDDAADRIEELAGLRDKDEETTDEHDLGAEVADWLRGDKVYRNRDDVASEVRKHVIVLDELGDVADDWHLSAPQPDAEDRDLRVRWALLVDAMDPDAPAKREAAAERLKELEADAGAELRRAVELYRGALNEAAAAVDRAFTKTGNTPRPSAEMRDAWRQALQTVRAEVTRVTDDADVSTKVTIDKLRRRDQAVAALVDRLVEVSDRAEGDEPGAPEAARALALLFGNDREDRPWNEGGAFDELIDAVRGARPGWRARPWGEETDAALPVPHPSPDPVDRVAAIVLPALQEIAGLVDRPDLAEAVAGPRWTVDLDGGPGGQAARAVVEAVEQRRGRLVRVDALISATWRIADLLGRSELGRDVKSWLYGDDTNVSPLPALVAAVEASPLRGSLRDDADPGGVVAALRGVAGAIGRGDLVARVDAWHAEILEDLSGRIPADVPAEVLAAVVERLSAQPPSPRDFALLESALAQVARIVDRPELAIDGLAPQAVVRAVAEMRQRLWGELPAQVEALRVIAEAAGLSALAAGVTDPDPQVGPRAAIEVATAVEQRLAAGPSRSAISSRTTPERPEPDGVVAVLEYRGVEIDLLRRGRQVLWRVRGVTPDSGGAPVELGRAPAPLARKTAEAEARHWVSSYLAEHPDRAPRE